MGGGGRGTHRGPQNQRNAGLVLLRALWQLGDDPANRCRHRPTRLRLLPHCLQPAGRCSHPDAANKSAWTPQHDVCQRSTGSERRSWASPKRWIVGLARRPEDERWHRGAILRPDSHDGTSAGSACTALRSSCSARVRRPNRERAVQDGVRGADHRLPHRGPSSRRLRDHTRGECDAGTLDPGAARGLALVAPPVAKRRSSADFAGKTVALEGCR